MINMGDIVTTTLRPGKEFVVNYTTDGDNPAYDGYPLLGGEAVDIGHARDITVIKPFVPEYAVSKADVLNLAPSWLSKGLDSDWSKPSIIGHPSFSVNSAEWTE